MIQLSTELELEELSEALGQLLEDKPHALRLYGIVAVARQGLALEDIYVDAWPEFNTVLARPASKPESELPDGLVKATSIFVKDLEKLPEAACLEEELHLDKHGVIAGVDPVLADHLQGTISQLRSARKSLTCDILRADEDKARERGRPTKKGYDVAPVTPEMYDAIFDNLTETDDVTKGVLSHCASHYHSLCCVPSLTSSEPVAHIIQQPVGSLGMLNVKPIFRGQGLAKYVIQHSALNLIEVGEPAWTYVQEDKTGIKTLFTEAGFTSVGQAVWLTKAQ